MAIVVCGKGSTTKSAAKSDPSLVSLRATVPSFGPAHLAMASIVSQLLRQGFARMHGGRQLALAEQSMER